MFCIAMMVHDEVNYLMRHLPILAQAGMPFVFVSTGADKTVDNYCRSYGPLAVQIFEYDWSKQANRLISLARACGHYHILRLDPDELMWPEEIKQVAKDLWHYDYAALPRYNFEKDERHYCESLYPDYQIRGFNVKGPFTYVNKVHESPQLTWNDHVIEVKQSNCHIYHFEGLISGLAALEKRALKNLNYSRIANDLPVLAALPDNFDKSAIKHRPYTLFSGDTPLILAKEN